MKLWSTKETEIDVSESKVNAEYTVDLKMTSSFLVILLLVVCCEVSGQLEDSLSHLRRKRAYIFWNKKPDWIINTQSNALDESYT